MTPSPLNVDTVLDNLPAALHADFPALVAHATDDSHWEDIAQLLDKAVAGDTQKEELYWDATMQLWLLAIADSHAAQVYELPDISIVSSKAPEHVTAVTDALMTLTHQCRQQTDAVFEDHIPLPPVVIVDSKQAYHEHLKQWAPRSEGATNPDDVLDTAYYIAEPVPQLVIYDLPTQRGAVARELALALLSPINRPLWLDRATALRIEADIDNLPVLHMDKKAVSAHRKFWNPSNMQQFWNGRLFAHGGHVYADALALYLLKALEEENPFFIEQFLTDADADDGGDSAAIEIFGEHLGTFLRFLRTEPAKNWQPRPQRW